MGKCIGVVLLNLAVHQGSLGGLYLHLELQVEDFVAGWREATLIRSPSTSCFVAKLLAPIGALVAIVVYYTS